MYKVAKAVGKVIMHRFNKINIPSPWLIELPPLLHLANLPSSETNVKRKPVLTSG
jgi:hypothetical protein